MRYEGTRNKSYVGTQILWLGHEYLISSFQYCPSNVLLVRLPPPVVLELCEARFSVVAIAVWPGFVQAGLAAIQVFLPAKQRFNGYCSVI